MPQEKLVGPMIARTSPCGCTVDIEATSNSIAFRIILPLPQGRLSSRAVGALRDIRAAIRPTKLSTDSPFSGKSRPAWLIPSAELGRAAGSWSDTHHLPDGA